MEPRSRQENEHGGGGGGRRELQTLLFIVGPPAVGKMTVGDEIARRTGFRLFHNHLSIEPVLRVFDFGSDAFNRLVDDFRRSVFEEVARSDLPGLIFTWVWAFDLPSEAATVERYAAPFRDQGSRVLFVELDASLDERLRRNETEFRLAEKASKRDVASSRRRLLEHEGQHRFSSDGAYDGRADWLRIDTTHKEPREVAELVIQHFSLGQPGGPTTPASGV
jgi:hypothetical protein